MKPDETNFAPGDVVLAPVPLVGTMGRTEVEHAAAILVRVCQVRGAWGAVTTGDVREVGLADVAAGQPLASMWTNPFLRPEFGGLVERGFARWHGEPFKSPLELTDEGRARLGRWVRRPAQKESADA